MTIYIIGAIILAVILAGFLLAKDGGADGVGAMGASIAILAAIVVIAASLADIVGLIFIVLKVIGVEPVASWTWLQVLFPLIAGLVAWASMKIVMKAFE